MSAMPSLSDDARDLLDLDLAVVGDALVGKKTLVSNLLEALNSRPTPLPAPRRPPSWLPSALHPVSSFLSRHIRLVPGNVHTHTLQNGTGRIVIGSDFDSINTASMQFPRGASLILLVARLDATLHYRREVDLLREILSAFGPNSLDHVLIVFTHGCERPPMGIDFAGFLRGRSDVFRAAVMEIFPPHRPQNNPDGPLQDPLPLPCCTVELSHECPVNEHGLRILPDGTPWMPALLAAMRKRAPAKRTLVPQVDTYIGPKFLLLEILASAVLVQTFSFVAHVLRERQKKREGKEEDFSFGISDEEYERLTRYDPEADELAQLERERFASDNDASGNEEELFFGQKKTAPPPPPPQSSLPPSGGNGGMEDKTQS